MTTTRRLFATATILGSLIGWFGYDADYKGPMRWEDTNLTISSTADIDLAQVTAAWGDTITFDIVEGPADIEFHSENLSDMAGGEARRTFRDGNYIADCDIAVEVTDNFAILTHELGHCLGLSHTNMQQKGSNMHWIAKDYQNGWSDTVTARDLADLTALYLVK
jgi:hypothetical protein